MRSAAATPYAQPGGVLDVTGEGLELLLAPGALRNAGVAAEHVDDVWRAVVETLVIEKKGGADWESANVLVGADTS